MMFLMLIGALGFSLFMMLCIENMAIAQIKGVKNNLVLWGVVFAFIILIMIFDIRFRLLIFLVLYSGTIALLYKSIKKAVIVITYSIFILFGASSVSFLFLSIIGRENIYAQYNGFVISAAAICVIVLPASGMQKLLRYCP